MQLAIGAGLIIVICVAAGLSKSKLGWPHVCIALALMASIAISIARVPVEVMHPVLAGPRYFFYPFIFLGWLLIELAAASNFGWIRAALLLPLIGATHQFVAYGPRGHHPIDWQQQMNACLAALARSRSRCTLPATLRKRGLQLFLRADAANYMGELC